MHRGDFTFISALQSLRKQTHSHRNKLKHNRTSIAVIITPKQSKKKMLNLEKILKQDRQIRATTGLNRQAFEALLPSFEEAYQQMLMKKRR